MAKHQDLTGMVFGRLTVLREAEKKKPGVYLWECECSCENHTHVIVEGSNLKNGNTKSCGCLHREAVVARNKAGRNHEEKYDRLYRIWKAMQHRCYSENDEHYHHYGGKGIVICDEWLSDFDNFVNWSINNGYNDTLTIDRVDSNKNYCPENCRWITQKEQTNNTSRNKYLEYKGRKQTLAQWCEELGLNYSRTKARINACGWTIEEAFEREKYAQVNLGK